VDQLGKVVNRGAWAARWAVFVCNAGLLIGAGCTDLFGFQGAESVVECLNDSDCPMNLTCISGTCAVRKDAGSTNQVSDATTEDATLDVAPESEGQSDSKPGDGPSESDVQTTSDSPPQDGMNDTGSEVGSDEMSDGPSGCSALQPSSRLLLFGGFGASGPLGDTWIWDGVSWTQQGDAGAPDASGPPARVGAAMGSACRVAVLAGGLGTGGGGDIPLADAWQWDGATWLPSSAAPPSRNYAAAATLGATLALFGGEDSTYTPQADWFIWSGTNWSPTPETDMWPNARTEHILAGVPGGLLLFGGVDILCDLFYDTWLWTGSAWVPQRYPDGSSPPSASALATAAAWGQSVLLFGGQDANCDSSNETWIWDGSTWTQAPPPQSSQNQPVARSSATMATLGGEVVLFGGLDSSNNPLSDTWIWNGVWTPGPQTGPPPRYAATMTAF